MLTAVFSFSFHNWWIGIVMLVYAGALVQK